MTELLHTCSTQLHCKKIRNELSYKYENVPTVLWVNRHVNYLV